MDPAVHCCRVRSAHPPWGTVFATSTSGSWAGPVGPVRASRLTLPSPLRRAQSPGPLNRRRSEVTSRASLYEMMSGGPQVGSPRSSRRAAGPGLVFRPSLETAGCAWMGFLRRQQLGLGCERDVAGILGRVEEVRSTGNGPVRPGRWLWGVSLACGNASSPATAWPPAPCDTRCRGRADPRRRQADRHPNLGPPPPRPGTG